MRRMYAGGLALLLALPLTAAAQDTVSQKEHLTTVQNLRETKTRLFLLQTELSNAHLQQTILPLRRHMNQHRHLLLGSGIVANPKLGKIPIGEGGEGKPPFVTFYPVSEARAVSLPDVGVCEIQGVVRLSVGAYRSEKNTCKPGSYLMALKTDANGMVSLSLLDADVDANGQIHYREALQMLAERVQRTNNKMALAFPGLQEVSPQHPAWQVQFDLPGKEQHVRAYLNLNIVML